MAACTQANDFLSLFEELNTDPDLGTPKGSLIGRMGVDVFLMAATPEMMADTISKLGTSEV
jgi:hypothetical protein